MSRRAHDNEPSALALAEQAVHLLRGRGRAALIDYYLGSLPFALGLLYFWSDMSRNPSAGWYCAPAAAGLALLFIWMKVWQARFGRRLWAVLQHAPEEQWSARRYLITAARQAALHATGMVVLPISAIVAFPIGWTYAFYQNASILESPECGGLRELWRTAARQAALWPGQNHLLLTILSLFGLFVFLNLGIGIVLLPHLLKRLLGIETVFTLSGLGMLNTTFFAILVMLTYLCVDPIVKSAYVLRCFYGLSRQSGDDLRAGLKPYLKTPLTVLALLFLLLIQSPNGVHGAEPSGREPAGVNLQAQGRQLDDAIEQTLQQRRFAWRLPREKALEEPSEQGWLGRTIQWIVDGVKAIGRLVGRWFRALWDWFDRMLPKPKPVDGNVGTSVRVVIQVILYVLGTILCALLVIALFRHLRRSRPIVSPVTEKEPHETVDLNDEGISAADLPTDRWLAMARTLLDQQEYTAALRALYLSILASLGESRRLLIARYKSNQEYYRELARRAHVEPELQRIFGRCMTVFEGAWYGAHPVSPQQIDQFLKDQQEIADRVGQPFAH
jgi:hypothetical protein